jgi:hypothetical protein
MQGLKDNTRRAVGVRIGLSPDNAPVRPTVIDRVTQNAAGDWMVDGEIVRDSMGFHEGKARAQLLVKQFLEADAEGRERLLKEWS